MTVRGARTTAMECRQRGETARRAKPGMPPFRMRPAVLAGVVAAAVTAVTMGAGVAAGTDGPAPAEPASISALDVSVFFGLLLLSALFSGAESALTAVSPIRVKTAAESGSRTHSLLLKLIADRSRLISALLIGNNIVNTALTTFATVVFTATLSSGLGESVAAALAATTSVVFLLVFGEVIPKTIGVNMPMQFATFVAWPVYGIRQALWPLTILLSGLQRMTLRLLRHDSEAAERVSATDIEALARLAENQEVLAVGAGEAIAKMVSLHETYVREVITPRIDVVGVSVEATYQDVIREFRTHRFSRLPVFEKDIDGIVGILTLRDVLGLSESEQAAFRAGSACRRVPFVPELKRANELILEMRRDRFHFAIVVDEFGGTAGVVTLEDLLESVVGQIEDEFDEGSPRFRKIGSGMFLIDGGVTISELENALRFNLPQVEGVDTVAGLFLKQSEKIPAEGDAVTFDKIVLEVRKMRGQRIARLLVRSQHSGRSSQVD